MTFVIGQKNLKQSLETQAPSGRLHALARSNLVYWLIVALIAVPVGLTYWHHTDPMGAARYFDFEKCYYATAKSVLSGGASVLESHFNDGTFMNVPIMAWVLTPIAHLNRIHADLAFAAISVVTIFATIFLLTRNSSSLTAPGLCLMFLLNGPLWYSLLLGNSTQIVLLCLVAALALWRRQDGYAVGLLIGVAAVIKPMIILFGIYFAFKKQWTVVLGGATVIVGALLGSVAIAGLDVTIYWYQHTLADFAGKPMPAFNVQSIEAFILRLSEGPESATNWNPHVLPVWGKIIRDFVFASLFGLVAYGLWIGRGRLQGLSSRQPPSSRDYLEFCLVLTLCVVTSTVSWTHYYLLLLLPYSLYFTGVMHLKEDRLTQFLIWTSLIFCSLPVHEHIFASRDVEAVFFKSFQSIWLFGGLLLFWALMRSVLSATSPNTIISTRVSGARLQRKVS
jgi:hypothetical protein